MKVDDFVRFLKRFDRSRGRPKGGEILLVKQGKDSFLGNIHEIRFRKRLNEYTKIYLNVLKCKYTLNPCKIEKK